MTVTLYYDNSNTKTRKGCVNDSNVIKARGKRIPEILFVRAEMLKQ